MKTVKFRFSTEVLRRLGEELNPNPDQGILELVKNAYDANAVNCTVYLKNVDQIGGSILVTDDGDGMNEDDIRHGWLLLGKSGKRSDQPTRLNRIPAGNKGLGRLAALRMGTAVALSTRPRGSSKQYDLHIDWTSFKDAETVDQVELNLEEITRLPTSSSGTEVLIESLRKPINRMAVKRLARSLILLADPFGDDPEGFKPRLVAPEFSGLEKLVRRRYFDDAEFYLAAKIDQQGCASARVMDWKGQELFVAEHNELSKRRDESPYACPPAKFDLWVFILSGTVFSTRQTSIGEVRTWLREFGGVHLYENGLRVMPYGNPGNDWLEMNLQRARNPEERPSTNTVIGRVSVFDIQGALVQKTDRSGFIEGEAFHELRAFAQDALDWMGRRRLEAAVKRRVQRKTETVKKSKVSAKDVEDAIETVPADSQEQLKASFRMYQRLRDKEVDDLRKEVQLYRTLSTAGITAATFAHESSGNPIKVIAVSINTIERRTRKMLDGDYLKTVGKQIARIKSSVDSLSVLGTATLKLLEHEKRRMGRVEIHRVIKNVLNTFEPFLKGRDVVIDTKLFPGNPFLNGSEAAVESIITNLLNNCLAAFERESPLERRILIQTDVEEDLLTVRVLDNGPGIKHINIKDIWLPGQTTREDGTGLGLTIVHDSVVDLGGRVDAIAESEIGGAEIIIELPVLGI